jgi:hypothetical protein
MSPIHIAIIIICIFAMVVFIGAAELVWLKMREEVNKTRPLEQQLLLGNRFMNPFEQHRQMRLIASEYRTLYPTGRLIQRHIICLYCALAAQSILAGYSFAGAASSNATCIFAGMWGVYLAGMAGALLWALAGSFMIGLYRRINFPRA